MTKILGYQSFTHYHDYEYVYKSDRLKVISSNGIEYKEKSERVKGKLVVSKYTKLSNLEKSISNRTFFFSSPIGWLDPFELLFYRPNMTINDERDITIHACCFACNDIENEEGFWQIWSKGEKEPIVRVTYNVEKLLSILNAQAGNQYTFYLAGMDYKNREDILKIANNYQDMSFDSIDNYLNMLCLKRNAYRYENELRLFVKRTSNDNSEYTIINNVDYNDGLVSEITLSPAEPFGNTHPGINMMRSYQKCLALPARQKLQDLVDKRMLHCKITQSALYCTDIKLRTYKL